MLINVAEQNSTIHSHGVISSEKFTMDISGKAFRVLSSALYQNKIGSIVREYSCNAMDAHIAVGKPNEPFTIHLPNDYEPWFSVKDNGTGLSHEDIKTVYTCMFKSSKDTSNTAVGCFGLGSKSAFSYTDNFTVVSIFNGIKRSYSAIIQPNGEPSILELACDVTKEPNGVEVSIAVNNNDFHKFAKEVAAQLQFLTVKPIIQNGSIEWNTIGIPTFSLDGFNLIKNNGYNRKTYVIQGGVGYPLDYDLIKDAVKDAALQSFIDFIRIENDVHLYFNIGDIEVTPSRENISYTISTKNNIVEKFKIAQKNMYTKFERDMDALPNNWARAEAIVAMGGLGFALTKVNNKWNIPITSNNHIDYDLHKMLVAEHEVTVQRDVKDAKGVITSTTVKEMQQYKKYVLSRQVMRRVQVKATEGETIRVADSVYYPVTIVYNDGAKFAPSRLNKYASGNSRDTLYYLIATNGNPITADEVKSFTDFLGGKELVPLSSLEVPERIKAVRIVDGKEEKVTYTPAKLWVLNASSLLTENIRNWQKVTDTAIKNMDGGLYVIIKDKMIESLSSMQLGFNLMNVPLYAIREKDLHRIEGNPAWVSFKVAHDEYVSNIKAQYKDKLVRFAVSILRHTASKDLIDRGFMNNMYVMRDTINDPELKKYVTKIFKSEKNYVKHTLQMSEYVRVLFSVELEKIMKDMKARTLINYNKIVNKYVMVSKFGNYCRTDMDMVNHFIIYANAVHGA